jgi:hypothetical protein
MELAASTTYAQPESEAVRCNGAKTVTVWLEIYKNGSSSGSATLAIQTWTDTKPQPYSRATGGGPLTPTGATFTIATTSLGMQQPIQFSVLADFLRFNVTANTLSNPIAFSITVFFTDV